MLCPRLARDLRAGEKRLATDRSLGSSFLKLFGVKAHCGQRLTNHFWYSGDGDRVSDGLRFLLGALPITVPQYGFDVFESLPARRMPDASLDLNSIRASSATDILTQLNDAVFDQVVLIRRRRGFHKGVGVIG